MGRDRKEALSCTCRATFRSVAPTSPCGSARAGNDTTSRYAGRGPSVSMNPPSTFWRGTRTGHDAPLRRSHHQSAPAFRPFAPSAVRRQWRRALAIGMTHVHLRFDTFSKMTREAEVRDLVAALAPVLNDQLVLDEERSLPALETASGSERADRSDARVPSRTGGRRRQGASRLRSRPLAPADTYPPSALSHRRCSGPTRPAKTMASRATSNCPSPPSTRRRMGNFGRTCGPPR